MNDKPLVWRYHCRSCGNWWKTPIYAFRSHQCPLCRAAMTVERYHGDDADLADAPLSDAMLKVMREATS